MDLEGTGRWWRPKQGVVKVSGGTRCQDLQSGVTGGTLQQGRRGRFGVWDESSLARAAVWSGGCRAVRGKVGGEDLNPPGDLGREGW